MKEIVIVPVMINETKLETEDWQLSCYLEWRPKNHQEKCEYCDGKGKVGGGFGYLEEAQQCDRCHGLKTVTKGPRTPRPELPKKLIEHMRRAWWDYFNE